MLEALVAAHRSLSHLETLATSIPDFSLFISMYLRKEALISSQIEGTQCTLDDLLSPEVPSNANLDVQEVLHYLQALNYAVSRLGELPLCNRLLLETHRVLLSGGRGSERHPGEFRRSQNWLGGAGCSLRTARYIPPNVEDMDAAVSELEKFINEDESMDPLISAALIHYQFETIHPFLDGNGRIGRMLILLYLMNRNLLSRPVLYISYFLKRNQLEYYDRMTMVRKSGNYEQWVSFFLEAVRMAADDASGTAKALSALHVKNKQLLKAKPRLLALFDYLEQHPIVDITHTAEALRESFKTISNRFRQLLDLGILSKSSGNVRNRTFCYAEYLAILRGDEGRT